MRTKTRKDKINNDMWGKKRKTRREEERKQAEKIRREDEERDTVKRWNTTRRQGGKGKLGIKEKIRKKGKIKLES